MNVAVGHAQGMDPQDVVEQLAATVYEDIEDDVHGFFASRDPLSDRVDIARGHLEIVSRRDGSVQARYRVEEPIGHYTSAAELNDDDAELQSRTILRTDDTAVETVYAPLAASAALLDAREYDEAVVQEALPDTYTGTDGAERLAADGGDPYPVTADEAATIYAAVQEAVDGELPDRFISHDSIYSAE